MRQFAAIDIGGTSAKCALIGEDGSMIPLQGFPTGMQMTRKQLETALMAVVSEAERKASISGIGISCLGVVDHDNSLVLSGVENMPCLQNFNFKSFFQAERPLLSISIWNDASAAAIGEQWLGAAKGCSNFICVAFGTGVGSCAVLNGKPVEGAHHRAGEIGYWDYKGDQDYWELNGSALGLVKRARKLSGDETLDGEKLFKQIADGEENSLCLYRSWLARAGMIFANLSLVLDMECIVVGGGISAQGEVLTCELERAMNACLPQMFRNECKVVPAQLGNHAALFGAVSELIGVSR